MTTRKRRNSINYDAAVREGKQIVAEMERRWWRLCELADGIVTRYGEHTVERFAQDIGVIPCTFVRRMSVYQAWKSAPGPKCYLPCFAVARELQSRPDRFEIIKAFPDLTKREASELARQWREHEQAGDDADDDDVGALPSRLPCRCGRPRGGTTTNAGSTLSFTSPMRPSAMPTAFAIKQSALRAWRTER